MARSSSLTNHLPSFTKSEVSYQSQCNSFARLDWILVLKVVVISGLFSCQPDLEMLSVLS